KATTSIGLLDTVQDLATWLAELSADLLVDTLLKLERREVQPMPQDAAAATYARLIQKQDYWLDWSRSAIALHNQVRGFFPNCVATFRDTALKIESTLPLGPAYWDLLPTEFRALEAEWSELVASQLSPGSVIHIAKGLGPIMQTGDGLLLLRDVKLAGKRSQSGWDFANGTRLEVGEVLGNGQEF
ncbi:MAG TPA: hypothetical protein V6D16_08955, partial [Candidatus Obscuribacterales bacterium]